MPTAASPLPYLVRTTVPARPPAGSSTPYTSLTANIRRHLFSSGDQPRSPANMTMAGRSVRLSCRTGRSVMIMRADGTLTDGFLSDRELPCNCQAMRTWQPAVVGTDRVTGFIVISPIDGERGMGGAAVGPFRVVRRVRRPSRAPRRRTRSGLRLVGGGDQRPAAKLAPQFAGLAVELGQRARIVHHDVGDGQPLLTASLRRDPRLGLLAAHAAKPDQPVELRPWRHVAHDDQVVGARQAVLGDERHVVHDDRAWPGAVLQLAHASADARVDDRVEDGELLLIGEDDVPESDAIQRPVRAEHVRAECRDHCGEPVRIGRNDLPCDQVGVDDDSTLRGKALRYLALAGSDATC